MRQGEALGLCWTDVDFAGGTLQIQHQLQRIDGRLTWFPIEVAATANDADQPGWLWHLVLAVPNERLTDWRPGFELTSTPVKRLWGPGNWQALNEEIDHLGRKDDAVSLLDRRFFLRSLAGSIEWPRSSEDMLALEERAADERWFLVTADNPSFALGHIRQAVAGTHMLQGPCEKCAADVTLANARRETIERMTATGD